MADSDWQTQTEPAEGLAAAGQSLPVDQLTFDEAAYLQVNRDVAESVSRGDFASGYAHYLKFGFNEGRPTGRKPFETANRVFQLSSDASDEPVPIDCCVESVITTADGGVMIIGWVDDSASPLDCIRIRCMNWQLVLDRQSLMRVRRADVEQALGRSRTHLFGFVGFICADASLGEARNCSVELWLESEQVVSVRPACRQMRAEEQRELLLTVLRDSTFFDNADAERMAGLDRGIGEQIIKLNRRITAQCVASPYVERFGPQRERFKGTIIVVLYGKPEFLALQNAIYSAQPGIEDYEFIYVCNSPELGQMLLRDAKLGSMVYGISQSVMLLGGNAGFGAANNAAAAIARSDRIITVNPDVFPRDPAWAARHSSLIEQLPLDQVRLFGAALYYDDGSLMHGGMYFEIDRLLSHRPEGYLSRPVARVEHYGKGAPESATHFLTSRPVPAVTGAFMSLRRNWFEKLGGFSEDFVFGHYEDADLCLRSLELDVPAWMHDLPMWHLEGKGSTRHSVHEGGAQVNRWLFTRRWEATINASLLGPQPSHRHLTGLFTQMKIG